MDESDPAFADAAPPDEPFTPFPELSPRRYQVAELLARGHSCNEIAEIVGVSVKTIDTHRCQALKCLGLKNAAQLALEFVRRGVIMPEIADAIQSATCERIGAWLDQHDPNLAVGCRAKEWR